MVRLMPLHLQTPSSLASFKSQLVLPFRYWLTQVVVEKRQLNGCYSSSKKVKFSHTRYRALGPELIPVYGQSARRWREVNHAVDRQ